MTWSLQIANGDLVFNGASMSTVIGSEKLVQDLACDILEPMGTDPLHPTFGSTISGGTLPDGTFQQGVIGGPNDAYAASYVNSEIQRICQSYQAQQQARYQADLATYGRSTLTADEVLTGVGGIVASQEQNVLAINATLTTGTGDQSVSIPVSS